MTSQHGRLLGPPNPPTLAPGHPLVDALLLAGPPATVVTVLHLTESVPASFLAYHVLWCLVAPALATSSTPEASWREHAHALGLERLTHRPSLLAGALVGTLMGAGILALFLAQGDTLLARAGLRGRLTAWGVPPGADAALFAYMILFNSVAEELYWRGYVHERLTTWRSRWAAILVTCAFFTSFHAYTIQRLVENAPVTVLFTAGVFAGALAWAILRERYGSVAPAVLAHVGATAGYMTVYVLWT